MAHLYPRQPPRGAKVAGSSPLGRGVTAHFLFNGDFQSSVRGKSGRPAITSGPTIKSGPNGKYAQGNGAGKVVTNLLASDLGIAGAAPRTIVTEFTLGDTNSFKCLFSIGDQSARSRSQFSLLIGLGYRTVQIATYNTDLTMEMWTAPATSARVFLAVTYDGNVTITARAWAKIDQTGQISLRTQTFTIPAPLETGNTFPLNLMGGGTYNFPSMDTTLSHLSIYGGRCLTPAEIDSLYVDRHQVIAPPQKFPYAALVAAVAPKQYGLSAAPGSFALAGQAINLRAARRLMAAQAAISFNGAAAVMRASRRLPAAGGEVALSGAAARVIVARRILAEPNGLSLTGAAVVLRAARRMAGVPESFSLAGSDIQLRAARRLQAGAGALAHAGSPVQLRAARRLQAAPGAFALAGSSIEMVYAPEMGPGLATYTLSASPGAFGMVGVEAALRAQRRMSVEAGTLLLTGASARVVFGRRLVAGAGDFRLQVVATGLRASRRMSAWPSSFDVSGADVQLRYSAQINYARAPAGPGYTRQQHYNESRPAATSSPRPAATQRTFR